MTASRPAITVLLPVYNDAGTLERAVRSIRRQRFRAWELLLLDDGSTDRTSHLARALRREDGRIRFFRMEHRGIAGALNRGLEEARAPLVARMDADDVSHPERLGLQEAALRKAPGLCGVGCRVRVFPRGGRRAGMLAYERWLNSVVTPEEIAREIFVESPLAHPSVLLRAGAVRRAGGYAERGPEDYDLWLRLHRRGERFAKVPRTLLWWMDRTDRISRSSASYSREAFRACKVRHLAALLGSQTRVLLVGNREAKRFAPLLREQGICVEAYVDVNPRRVGGASGGVPVYGYADLDVQRRDRLLLVAVGSRGAREQIRKRLQASGLRETEHFLCIA